MRRTDPNCLICELELALKDRADEIRTARMYPMTQVELKASFEDLIYVEQTLQRLHARGMERR